VLYWMHRRCLTQVVRRHAFSDSRKRTWPPKV